MVVIEIHTATPSGYINTFSRKINPYAQWLSHYTPILLHIPNGSINAVSEIKNSYA